MLVLKIIVSAVDAIIIIQGNYILSKSRYIKMNEWDVKWVNYMFVLVGITLKQSRLD